MSNTTFGPAELMKYIGMGDPASMAAGSKRFAQDLQAATANSPTGPGTLQMPAGDIVNLQSRLPPMPQAAQGAGSMPGGQGALAQAMAERQMAGQGGGLMGPGGVLGLPQMPRR